MAPTTRRNASKKVKKTKSEIDSDSKDSINKKRSDDVKDHTPSSSEVEMSDNDADFEKMVEDSANQILSRISVSLNNVQRTTSTSKLTNEENSNLTQVKEYSGRKSKRQLKGAENTRRKLEETEDNMNNSDEHEVQFVIDTKPFSRRKAATPTAKSKTSDFLDDIDNMDCSSDDSDNSDEKSDCEDSGDERNDNDEMNSRNTQISIGSKAKPRMSSLQAQISEEILRMSGKKDDFGMKLSSELDPGTDFGGSYVSYDIGSSGSSKQQTESLENILQKSKDDKLIKKSIITPDFEKKHDLPKKSLNQQKKQRKQMKESKTGKGWYDMPAQEMSDELRNDLRLLRMRSVLDPKRFYKHNDSKSLPKFVQVGTVVDTPIDFYHGRVPSKQRKQTVVDELLADAEMRRFVHVRDIADKLNNHMECIGIRYLKSVV